MKPKEYYALMVHDEESYRGFFYSFPIEDFNTNFIFSLVKQ